MAYKGVYWHKTRWLVRISFGGKQLTVGRFDDEKEAARAYDQKARQLYGNEAQLNFPDEVPMAVVKEISVNSVSTGAQARVKLNDATVQEYREPAKTGRLPPVIAFTEDDACYFLGDGHHTLAAHRAENLTTIRAEVRRGSMRDAVLFAAGANATHGLPRTPDDKRRAVEMILADDEWAKASDRWVADVCHVSHPFVAKVRNNGHYGDEDVSTGNVSSCGHEGEENSEESEGEDSANEGSGTNNGKRTTGKDGRKRKKKSSAGGGSGRKNTSTSEASTGQPVTKDDMGNNIPNRLRSLFAANEEIKKAVVAARKTAKLFKEVESSAGYMKAHEEMEKGDDKRLYSTWFMTGATKLEHLRPALVCKDCGGEDEPSESSDPCEICGGKGYLMAEEIEAGEPCK